MPDDQLRDIIQGLRSRLHEELETQLESLTRSHEQALQDARRAGAAEAEQQWASRMETANQEWTARLENEIAAARAESEKQFAAEGMRIRLEATQQAAEAASRERQAFEAALAEERQRAEQQMQAERERAERDLTEARSALDQERRRAEEAIAAMGRAEAAVADAQLRAEAAAADARARVEAATADAQSRVEAATADAQSRVEAATADARSRVEAAIEEARRQPPPGANGARLLDAIRRLDDATSLSDVLTLTTAAAAAEAPRVTLFIVNTDHLEPWTVEGAAAISAGWVRVDGREGGLIGDAVRDRHAVTSAAGGPVAPAFASLPAGRTACAVPFMLGGQPVAVLYADEGAAGDVPPAWQEAVQILGRHASACLAHLTALRTTQAMRLLSGSSHAAGNGNDDEQGARRYARLLVSEIKLYNESAVRLGRQKRDLLQRLRPEIDRARRLYDERVPSSVHSRDTYFQQELVQTLADGDPALLGHGPT